MTTFQALVLSLLLPPPILATLLISLWLFIIWKRYSHSFLWNGYRSLLMWNGPNSLIMMLFIMTSCLYHFSSLWRSPKSSLLHLSAGRSCDRAMFIRISIAFWRRSNRPRTYQMPLNEALASSRPVCHFYCLFIFTVCWVDKKQNKTKKAYLMFTKVHASKRLSK